MENFSLYLDKLFGIDTHWLGEINIDTSLLVRYTQECCYNCMNSGWTKSLIHNQVTCMSPRNLLSWEIVSKSWLICSPSWWKDCPWYEALR